MKKRQNTLLFLSISAVIISVLTLGLSNTAVAHRSGCHRWHSCPSDSGSYTCGDWGYSNYCGSQLPAVYVPTITSSEEVSYEEIPAGSINQNNTEEYVGYKKEIRSGQTGRRKISTSITYSDGVEISKSEPIVSIEAYPVDSITEVGTRAEPMGYIDYIWEGEDMGFWIFKQKVFSISAAAQPNSNYALMKNDKVIQLAESSRTGLISFDGVGLRTGDKLSIGTYQGKKVLWFMPEAIRISEKYTVNIEKLSVLSEYNEVHKLNDLRTMANVKYEECSDEVKISYIKSLDGIDKQIFDFVESETLYYLKAPCIVPNQNYAKE